MAIQSIGDLVGRAFADGDVRAFLSAIDAKAVEEEDEGKLYWLSKRGGVEIHGQAATKAITHVFTYGDPAGGFAAYSGVQPFGISLAMDRATVGALLGAPAKAGPKNDMWIKGALKIMIMYLPDGRIKTLCFGAA